MMNKSFNKVIKIMASLNGILGGGRGLLFNNRSLRRGREFEVGANSSIYDK